LGREKEVGKVKNPLVTWGEYFPCWIRASYYFKFLTRGLTGGRSQNLLVVGSLTLTSFIVGFKEIKVRKEFFKG